MTLLDAPRYDPRRDNLIRNSVLATLGVAVLAAILTVVFWDWPQQHRVNHFFSLVENHDLPDAFAYWTNDPAWKQHSDRYSGYNYAQFSKDWGPEGDYGVIRSHKISITKTVGTGKGKGVVMGVNVNGGKTPLFLVVNLQSKEIGFSPVELYVGPD